MIETIFDVIRAIEKGKVIQVFSLDEWKDIEDTQMRTLQLVISTVNLNGLEAIRVK